MATSSAHAALNRSAPRSASRGAPQLLGATEERLISGILSLTMLILVYLGFVEFVSWPQVDVLWAFRLPPEAVTNHPHYYRYLVVYPGFVLGDYGVPHAFSLYVAGFMVCGQLLLRAMILPTSRVYAVAAQMAYLSVHFFMNGRGGIAWAAWTLAIYAITDAELHGWRIRHGVMAILAILASAVSSGTLLVVYATSAIVMANCLITPGKRRGALFLLPGVAYFLNYLLVSIDKNVAFYQEGNTDAIINMLGHGWGILLEQSRAFIFVVTGAVILLPFVAYYYATRYSLTKLAILFVPIGGGAFGFTTLTLVVPSLLVTLFDWRGRKAAS